MSRFRIIMWGEFPPNTHNGISVSNKMIFDILQDQFRDIAVVEENAWNKKFVGKIIHFIKNYFRVSAYLLKNKNGILYFNLPLSTAGLFRLLIFLPVARMIKTKNMRFLAHLHRGDLRVFYNKKLIHRIFLELAFFCIDEIIVLSNLFIEDIKIVNKRVTTRILHNTSEIEGNGIIQKEYTGNFICLSNYIESKGIRELVDCFKSDELKGLTLSIYGNIYDQSFFNELVCDKTGNVNLNHGINRNDIINILRNFDALVLPSPNEGQPIVILEAISIGMPVIANYTGDIPNMLGRDYKFLAIPQNKDSLLSKIKQFDQYEIKDEISDYLYSRYKENYSNRIYEGSVREIFKRL